MPRTQDEKHAIGYVRGRLDQLRDIRYRMDRPNHRFSRTEVIEMLWEIHRTELAIQTNVRSVTEADSRQVLNEYVAMARSLHDRALELLETVGGAAGIELPPRPASPAMGRNTVDKPKRKKKAKKQNDTMCFGDESCDEDELAEYASDNENPMAIGAMSAVYPSKDAKLLKPEDLRHAIHQAKRIRDEKISQEKSGQRYQPARYAADNYAADDYNWNYNQPGPSRAADRPERSSMNAYPRSTISVVSNRSGASTSSYVSQPLQRARGPITGILYPPMARESPVPISSKDKTLIGRSEFFTTVIDYKGCCPICKGRHKVFRCNTFLRAGLQERWYWALKYGLCLNCLYHKHSSFTCAKEGHCKHCKVRHDSLLCPEHPDWKDKDKPKK